MKFAITLPPSKSPTAVTRRLTVKIGDNDEFVEDIDCKYDQSPEYDFEAGDEVIASLVDVEPTAEGDEERTVENCDRTFTLENVEPPYNHKGLNAFLVGVETGGFPTG